MQLQHLPPTHELSMRRESLLTALKKWDGIANSAADHLRPWAERNAATYRRLITEVEAEIKAL